jgi:quercetin dioxygenase-like cupin family protein
MRQGTFMEIRRFGIGHRRPDGPPGSTGVSSAVIESGPRGTIAELAFVRGATVQPHANPNPTWFVVVEGGGFVRSGDVRTRVAAGEAVLFEPGEVHSAWTELSEMRVLVVDLGLADPVTIAGLLEGRAREVPADGVGTDAATRADGALRTGRAPTYDPSEGEPA